MPTTATLFVTAFIAMYAAHLLSDYPLQTDRLAARKAGWTELDSQQRTVCHHHGWGANQAHAGIHTLTTLLLLLTVPVWALELPVSAAGLIGGLAWIHVSHGLIDRRWPIAWWMDHTGQASFRKNGGGAAHVDQAAHLAIGLLPAALLLAKLS
ncbi:DUF3307 domain-containing protein [Streptomyces sp. NPDC057695]|uniref:DUF3307 domain-containing protein n=1 Tax=Streptomyces sp. NPDC057695 TaxID=3346217 RepID=UPI0036A19155